MKSDKELSPEEIIQNQMNLLEPDVSNVILKAQLEDLEIEKAADNAALLNQITTASEAVKPMNPAPGKAKRLKIVSKSGEVQMELKAEASSKEVTSKEPAVSELEYKRKVQAEHRVIGRKEEIKALDVAIKNDLAALLIGDTGNGKTYLIQERAQHYKKKMVRVSLNGEIGINELLGKWLVREGSTYWQDGTLTECMRNGDWIILDEFNSALPEVLFCLNPLLDDGRSIVLAEKDNELVVPHPDFRVFATMNPTEDYAGTKDLNPALLSRFSIVLWVENYEPAVEQDIVVYQSGIDRDIAAVMVDVANAIRESRKQGKTWYICSTRDVVNWARVFQAEDLTMQESFDWAIFNKAPHNEKNLIISAIKGAVAVPVTWKDKKEKVVSKLTENLKANRERLQKECQELEKKKDEIKKRIGAEIANAIK